jgi:hypothetical protein
MWSSDGSGTDSLKKTDDTSAGVPFLERRFFLVDGEDRCKTEGSMVMLKSFDLIFISR